MRPVQGLINQEPLCNKGVYNVANGDLGDGSHFILVNICNIYLSEIDDISQLISKYGYSAAHLDSNFEVDSKEILSPKTQDLIDLTSSNASNKSLMDRFTSAESKLPTN